MGFVTRPRLDALSVSSASIVVRRFLRKLVMHTILAANQRLPVLYDTRLGVETIVLVGLCSAAMKRLILPFFGVPLAGATLALQS